MIPYESWKNLGASVSLANLLLIGKWDDVQDHWFDYFRKLPNWWFLSTQTMFSLFLYAVIVWGILSIFTTTRSRYLRKACFLLLLGLFLVALDISAARISALDPIRSYVLGGIGLKPLVGILAIGTFLVVVWLEERGWIVMRTFLLIMLPLLPLVLFQSLRYTSGAGSAFVNKALLPSRIQEADKPRVVWIIFDEFDQQLAFASRPGGLDLTELDRFRRGAFYAEHAQTAGNETLVSIPALLTGKEVARTKRQGPNDLLLSFAGETAEVLWSRQPNVFSRARQMGVNTALVGFYHPYCRILEDLSYCYWSPATFVSAETTEYLEALTVYQRIVFYLEEPLLRSPIVSRLMPQRAARFREKRIVSFRSITEHAMQVATNPEFGLAFIHWPVPHPPGFYDRHTHTFSTAASSSYLDNLALVDLTLTDLRERMEAEGLWHKTTILITSDHPLRGGMLGDALPIREEFDASNALRSREVPFLIKLAGETEGTTYEKSFNTVVTERLVLAILAGHISKPEELTRWLDTNRRP